ADVGARGERHGGDLRRERPRRDRMPAREPGRRPRPDGRDDAGDGRLRDDAGRPLDARVQPAADHLADGEGDEGRPRALDPVRRVRLHHEARRHGSAPVADAGVAVPLSTHAEPSDVAPERDLETLEIDLLLEAIFRRYGLDFREYAPASLKRRLYRRMQAEGLETLSQLQDRLLHHPPTMEQLLVDLSINVTAMFRDPSFYVAVREKVVPLLHTYPFTRIWCAGCSTGEEVYS